MDIEDNDFEIIIYSMLLVFVISLWLVLENLRFQISCMLSNIADPDLGKYKNLIKSNFLFNVTKDNRLIHAIQNIIQYAVILFPFFTIVLVSWMDLEPAWSNVIYASCGDGNFVWGYGTPSSLLLRFELDFYSALIILIFSIASCITSCKIDKLVSQNNNNKLEYASNFLKNPIKSDEVFLDNSEE